MPKTIAVLFPGRSVDNPYAALLQSVQGKVDKSLLAIPPDRVADYRKGGGRQPMQEEVIFSAICDKIDTLPEFANAETLLSNNNAFLRHAGSHLKRIQVRLLNNY